MPSRCNKDVCFHICKCDPLTALLAVAPFVQAIYNPRSYAAATRTRTPPYPTTRPVRGGELYMQKRVMYKKGKMVHIHSLRRALRRRKSDRRSANTVGDMCEYVVICTMAAVG